MRKVAFIGGVPNSAYDINMMNIKEMFKDDIEIDIYNMYDLMGKVFYIGEYEKIFVLSWWMREISAFVSSFKSADKGRCVAIVGGHSHIKVGIGGGLRVYDSVLCVNNRIVRELDEAGIVSKFICWPYDEKLFHPQEHLLDGNKFVVGWAGNCDRECKRYGIVRDVIKKSRDSNIEFKISAVAVNKDNNGQIYVRHDVKREDMGDFYRSLNCYLVTSTHEGQPKTGIEAALCGVPVISTDVGVMRDIGAWILKEPLTSEAVYIMLKRMNNKRSWCEVQGKASAVLASKIWNSRSVKNMWREVLEV